MPKISLKPFFCKPNFTDELRGMTSFGGLPLVRDVVRDLKLISEMKWFDLKHAGYDDSVILEALLLLLISGGRHLSDWEFLKLDPGFAKLFPADLSVDTIERYLDRLDLTELAGVSTERGRVGYTRLLERLHQRVLHRRYVQMGAPKKLTLDLDATLIETGKHEALYCYDKYKAYQPLIGYCPELGMVICHEFRDGNIPASLGNQRLIERAQEMFPDVNWTVRSDAAAYENALLDWMHNQGLRFFIGADRTSAMQNRISLLEKSPEWKPYTNKDGIKTGEEHHNLNHGPSFSAQAELDLRIHARRYIVIRKKTKTADLIVGDEYFYSVIVTNDLSEDIDGLIREYRGRCGSVEYAHSQIKGQCGMEVMPSGKFHVNAAYFSMGILAHNVIRYMQHHALPESYRKMEIQTIRFRLIRVVAKIINKARSIMVKYLSNNPIGQIHDQARSKFAAYSP